MHQGIQKQIRMPAHEIYSNLTNNEFLDGLILSSSRLQTTDQNTLAVLSRCFPINIFHLPSKTPKNLFSDLLEKYLRMEIFTLTGRIDVRQQYTSAGHEKEPFIIHLEIKQTEHHLAVQTFLTVDLLNQQLRSFQIDS